jgi:NAD(P)-dependent dehydrogenase (short-subunit alcohol dehydrogenase family)
MSHLVIVGASKGIGRDVQPYLSQHRIAALARGASDDSMIGMLDAIHRDEPIGSFLLCQRYRGDNEWDGEIATSLTRTKAIMEWASRYSHRAYSIVVMASVAAVSVEEEQPVSYHAAKAALVEMVKYYAVTLGRWGTRVNAIIPGLTIKPEARAFYDAHPELEATYKDITPLGRMGTMADIAHLVDFLISARSSYLTGHTITLDGGISLRSPWALARRVTPALRELPVTQKTMVSK